MDYQDYNTPVKFNAPAPEPGRRPVIPKVLVIIGIGIVVVVVVYYGVMAAIGSYINHAMSQSFPPARVVTGTSPNWRVLEKPGGIGLMGYNPGGFVIGDFDGDGDEEILKIAVKGRSLIYEADGSRTTAGINGQEFIIQLVAWDYDRDGIAEIITPTIHADVVRQFSGSGSAFQGVVLEDNLPVIRLDGSLAGNLAASGAMTEAPLIADIDADGFDELLVYDQGSSGGRGTWRAFGKDGVEVATASPTNQSDMEASMSGTFTICGDVDGDSRADLIYPVQKMSALACCDFTGRQWDLAGWDAGVNPPDSAYDLDGDGCAEILSALHGFLNPVDGQYTELQLPPLEGEHTIGYSFTCGDINADGVPEIYASSMFNSNVLGFNINGTCTYHEELGTGVFNTAVLHSGGRDYLVVQLMNKLMISQ